MTSLMSEGLEMLFSLKISLIKRKYRAYLAEVIGRGSSSREGRVEYDNTVILGGTGVVGGEGSVAEQASTGTRDETKAKLMMWRSPH